MKTIFRKLLLASGLLLVLLLAIGIGLQLLYGGYAKDAAVKAINERLDAELVVTEIGFSVFRHFPFASVDLTGVELKEGIRGSTKPLLIAEKVSAQFNILSMLRGDYTIKRLRVQNGRLNTAMDKTGKGNYFVFKKSSDTTATTEVRIETIVLLNVEIEHTDLFNDQSYAVFVKQATASGEFSAARFTTTVDADLHVRNALVDGVNYLRDKPATLALALYVDLEQELYKFSKCRLAVSEATFNMTGLVARTKKGYDLNLSLNGEDIGLEELGSLMPNDYYQYLRGFSTKGDLTCAGTIKGVLGKRMNPAVEFTFGIRNGTISHSGETMKKVNLNAVYANGNGPQRSWNASVLRVNAGSVVFNGSPFLFSLELSRFDNPNVVLNLNGTVDLAYIKPLLGLGDNDELRGVLQLANFNYRGTARKMGTKDGVATQSSGTVVLKDVHYNNGSSHIKSLNGTFVSDGNNLHVHSCSAIIGKSDVSVSGSVQNIIPAVIAGLQKSPVTVNLTLVSQSMDVNDFMPGGTSTEASQVNSRQETPATAWWNHVSGKALCNIGKLRSNQFEARDVQVRLAAESGLVRFNGLQLAALGGSVMADGSVDVRKAGVTVLESTLACKQVDVHRLFREFNNFSQDAITADNLAGELATRCYVKAIWRNGTFMSDELVAVADVSIDKGELKRYQPMYALSKFAKVDDLENIRFSRLSNQIEIRRGVIHIPSTVIRSSVATIELSGSHTLENIIDYRLKLNLGQMVTNKFRRVSTFDPDALESDANGTFNLYVRMKGPAGSPTITYDKATVKMAVQQNIADEGKSLRQTLRQEFSRQENKEYKQQEVRDWEAPEEYELLDLDANADVP